MTVTRIKGLLDQLRRAVKVTNKNEYDEAISGLKWMALELCKSHEREKAIEKMLQEQMKVGDAQFFRAMIPVITEADLKGSHDYGEVFGEN